jgi:hypothetical protein
MVILEQPYVSDGLLEYLVMNQIPVLKNSFSEGFKPRRYRLNIVEKEDFVARYNRSKKIYTVSEYALDCVFSTLKDAQLNRQITLLKNKAAFREACEGVIYYTPVLS